MTRTAQAMIQCSRALDLEQHHAPMTEITMINCCLETLGAALAGRRSADHRLSQLQQGPSALRSCRTRISLPWPLGPCRYLVELRALDAAAVAQSDHEVGSELPVS